MSVFDLGHGINDGSHRHLNQSLAWRAIEEQKLAEQPKCEICGAPAVEAHNVDRCTLAAEPDYRIELAQSVCASCHDTVCPTRARTRDDNLIDEMLR